MTDEIPPPDPEQPPSGSGEDDDRELGPGRNSVYCPQCDDWYVVSDLEFVDSDDRLLGTFASLELRRKRIGRWSWRNRPAEDLVFHPRRRRNRELVEADFTPRCGRNHRLLRNLAEPNVVALIGEVGSSKTTYLAGLSKRLERVDTVSKRFDMSLIDGGSADELRKDASQIFDDRLPILKSDRLRGPFIYELTLNPKSRRPKLDLVSFYDIPGELLRTQALQAREATFSIRASGYMLLVDPTCIPELKLGKFRAKGSPDVNRDIVDSLWQLLRQLNSLESGRLDTPFVIALSKADLLDLSNPAKDLLGPAVVESIKTGIPLSGGATGRAVKELLMNTSAAGVVRAAETHFGVRNVRYSLMSSCGEQDVGGQLSAPRPVLVEQPFLEVLKGMGWI